MSRPPAVVLSFVLLYQFAAAQVIEFESRGLKFQTLTRNGVTVMFAPLAAHLKEYGIVQASVSNGSSAPYVIRPEDFYYVRANGETVQAAHAESVVATLMQKGSGSDVIKLVNTYEAALYGIPHMRSTNGYEQRREAALAFGSSKIRAAATAAAVAFVQSKLMPGETTDGAIFFPIEGKPLGPGHVQVRTNTDTFEFNPEPVATGN